LKLELKYGLLITVGIIAWVVTAHLLVPNPCSAFHMLGPIVFFNLLEVGGIYFGISARKGAAAGQLKFKAGLKTGVRIAVVYGICSCLFFLVVLKLLGSKIMCAEPGARALPLWQLAAVAFAGQFGGAVVCGLIYSTIIAFFLAKREA
jgi:hypothetical protein